MKRAFIRLFGCVLSAIGLSMSYDTTLTVLLDDDSAPGVAWAAQEPAVGGSGSGGSGSGGSGSCVFDASASCYPTVPSGILVDFTGVCNTLGLRADYFVVLSPWYVGWLNSNYPGFPNNGVGWPTNFQSYYLQVPMYLTFSGSSKEYKMRGTFARDNYGINPPDLCSGNYATTPLGVATGIGDPWQSESWRSSCVVNVDEFGGFATYSRVLAAVYLPSATPYAQAGCCLVTGSSQATGTGCKCFYGMADKQYTYKVYRDPEVGSSSTLSTNTRPFYQPYVFYSYKDCIAGYYQNSIYTGTDVNFAMDLLSLFAEDHTDMENGSVCFDSVPFDSIATTLNEMGTAYYKNYWGNCGRCPIMESIYNKSDFSPTITSNGTMSMTTSDSGTGIGTCNATVKGAKDATGTFDIVGSCSY